MTLSHLFPFITRLREPRNTRYASVAGFYRHVNSQSMSNKAMAFEATLGPPPLNLRGTTGYVLPQCGGPVPAFDNPGIEMVTSPTPGLLQVGEINGLNSLFNSPDSSPESELF